MKKKILVSGANGQLGRTFREIAVNFPEYDWHFLGKDEMDLKKEEQIITVLNDLRPDYLLNCAAYTAVDLAESEKEKAMLINSTALKWIGEHCKKTGCKLIHFSTDYVYHNNHNRPLKEIDECSPTSVYGQSKLSGEKELQKYYPDSLILRTSWVYAPFGKNFFITIQKLAEERDELKVVDDQIGTPTYTFDLVKTCMEIIENYQKNSAAFPKGIYNYSNEGVCSWFDFAHAIIEFYGKKVKLIPVETHEFPAKAPRPSFSLMSKKKIEGLNLSTLPHWRDSLKKCINWQSSKLIKQDKRS